MYDHADETIYDARRATANEPPMTRADEIVDQLMPQGFEWRRLTRDYPRVAVAVAFAGGVVLGRTHGGGLIGTVGGFLIGEVSRNVQGFVDDIGS